MHGSVPHPDGAVVVLTTVENTDQARSLARDLVSRRLAACVTALPARSVYSWEGGVHEDAEVLLLIKTSPQNVDYLEHFLQESHPFELPEFLVLPVGRGSQRYLDWLHDATQPIDTEEG